MGHHSNLSIPNESRDKNFARDKEFLLIKTKSLHFIHRGNHSFNEISYSDMSYDYEHPTTPSTPRQTTTPTRKPTTKPAEKRPTFAASTTVKAKPSTEAANLPTTDLGKSSCSTGFVLDGVRLVGGLYSGTYRLIGHVENMDSCMKACCEVKECTVAFMDRSTCYAMKCLDRELCKSTIAGSNSSVGYVARDGSSLFRSAHNAITDATVIGQVHDWNSSRNTESVNQGKDADNKNRTKQLFESNPAPETSQGMDFGYCEKEKTLKNHRLMGGMKAGTFHDHGEVEDMETCSEYCCRDKECHLAYMVDKSCYSVKCFNSELCQTFTAPNFFLNPVISFVSRTRNSSGEFLLIIK